MNIIKREIRCFVLGHKPIINIGENSITFHCRRCRKKLNKHKLKINMEKTGTETGLTVKSEMMSKLDMISQKLSQIKLVAETVYKTNGKVTFGKVGNVELNIFHSNDLSLLISVFGYMTTEYNEYENAAKELNIINYPIYALNGFSYSAWKHDILIRVAQLTSKAQIEKLQKAKSVLEGYMSQDDRLAIALKEIDDMGL